MVTPTDPLVAWLRTQVEIFTARVLPAAHLTKGRYSNWRARQAAAGRKEFCTASTPMAPMASTHKPGLLSTQPAISTGGQPTGERSATARHSNFPTVALAGRRRYYAASTVRAPTGVILCFISFTP